MTPTVQPPRRRWTKRHLGLALGLLLVAGIVAWLAWKYGLLDTANAIVLALREAGPVVFFAAMALLPAAGFPLIGFTLAAGPVFGPTLGAGWVVAWALTAVVVNLLLTYWLADRALRPLIGRLLAYFEFRLPNDTTNDAWQLALIVRLTPGPPYWVQSYLLGLIRVPLVPYLIISTAVQAGYIVALVYGGEAIAQGRGRTAFVAVVFLLLVAMILQLLRRRTARRKAAALSALPAK